LDTDEKYNHPSSVADMPETANTPGMKAAPMMWGNVDSYTATSIIY